MAEATAACGLCSTTATPHPEYSTGKTSRIWAGRSAKTCDNKGCWHKQRDHESFEKTRRLNFAQFVARRQPARRRRAAPHERLRESPENILRLAVTRSADQ